MENRVSWKCPLLCLPHQGAYREEIIQELDREASEDSGREKSCQVSTSMYWSLLNKENQEPLPFLIIPTQKALLPYSVSKMKVYLQT